MKSLGKLWQEHKQKRRAWLLSKEDDVRKDDGNEYPPTPRDQNKMIHAWMQEHTPTFTETAVPAPRWRTDEIRLHVPLGLTDEERRRIEKGLAALIKVLNTPRGNPPPGVET